MKNAELLDESVANSGSLKNQRLNTIAQKAVNPNPTPSSRQMTQESQQEQEEMENSNEEQYEHEERTFTKPDYSSSARNTKKSVNNDADEKKILGMKPIVFYGALAGLAIIGGLILYSKYGKKGKKIVGETAKAAASATEVAGEAAKSSASAAAAAAVV